MNLKILAIAFFAVSSILSAAPILRLHDGKAWRDLTADEWKKLPRTELKTIARDRAERTYSGVPMTEVLKLLQAPAGPTLRGPEMSRVILITSADGYQVSFSLAELDDSFRRRNILLADKVDGKPLTEFEGSAMLICPDELRHSRWIRQIKEIILTRPIIPKP